LILYTIVLCIFRPNRLPMERKDVRKRLSYTDTQTESNYHLCPRCFPFIDLYCELCQGHGEYAYSDSNVLAD